MFKPISWMLAALVLSGCAGLNNVTSEVSSYGQWPADRKPASYAFERLPSQQARPEQQQPSPLHGEDTYNFHPS